MADRYIPEHRRANFKAKSTFKPEELRRRREEQQVEIRKAKREENLAKRRGIATGENRPGASLGAAPDSDDETTPTESQVCFLLLYCSLSCSFPSALCYFSRWRHHAGARLSLDPTKLPSSYLLDWLPGDLPQPHHKFRGFSGGDSTSLCRRKANIVRCFFHVCLDCVSSRLGY